MARLAGRGWGRRVVYSVVFRDPCSIQMGRACSSMVRGVDCREGRLEPASEADWVGRLELASEADWVGRLEPVYESD